MSAVTRSALAIPLAICAGLALSGTAPAQRQQQRAAHPAQQTWPEQKEGDYTAQNFRFGSGEVLPELRLHYITMGTPQRDANGRVTNAVLIMHGTGGSGRQFLSRQFAGELYGPGQPLDASRYFIILPDAIGHGGSSKPSDGLRMKFPQFDYDDMVRAQHLLVTEGLGLNHLRLVMGTSMGCMHSFVWAETYPDMMDALLPLACLPVEIAGRNRQWRKLAMDAIRNDPSWQDGNYTEQPVGLRSSIALLQIVGLAPHQQQKSLSTREQADKALEDYVATRMRTTDANDFLYQFNSSRNYHPAPHLGKITAPVVHINFADDFINPPELGIAEREIKKVKRGRYILVPIGDDTVGHGTHTRARVWKHHLVELLHDTEP
ncbi:MAG: alpha/beta fold hydrolase [Candidatus Acidiferrales bacterium]